MFEVAADNQYVYIFKYRACGFEMAAMPVRSKCMQVRSVQRLRAWWQAERALIVKQTGKGLKARSACRFEMAAAGPAEAPEAPGMLAGREGSDRQAAREGPACSKWLQAITTCTYSSTEPAGSKWLQGLLVRNACRFEMAAAGPAEPPEAPGMVAGREGSDSQADREGPEGSKCMQVLNGCCRSSRGSRGSRHAGRQRGL